MTRPNPVLAGATLNLTRRTLGGTFFLRPDPVVNQTFRFTLALCAMKHGIQLHASVALSNHHHTIVSDPHRTHPDFRRDFHSFLTRSLNQHHRLWGAKWAPDENLPTILYDREATLQSVAYVQANASRHHLVEDPEDWPGFASRLEDLSGASRIVRKPVGFYDPQGDLPDEVPLQFIKPAAALDLSDDAYRAEISQRVDALRERARAERQRKRVTVVGRPTVLQQEPTAAPTRQPAPRTRKPLVKCLNVTLRVAVLRWLKAFRRAYDAARCVLEAGDSSVEFPAGTYLLEKRYGVNCAATGPPLLPHEVS